MTIPAGPSAAFAVSMAGSSTPETMTTGSMPAAVSTDSRAGDAEASTVVNGVGFDDLPVTAFDGGVTAAT